MIDLGSLSIFSDCICFVQSRDVQVLLYERPGHRVVGNKWLVLQVMTNSVLERAE